MAQRRPAPLPADARAPGIARELVALGAGLLSADQNENAALLVSELVTNAVQHGRPDITLRVVTAPGSIRVEVQDGGHSHFLPTEDPLVPIRCSGRGLIILDALATRWGITATATDEPGKYVWFELRAHPTERHARLRHGSDVR